jgi:hypothetical protein
LETSSTLSKVGNTRGKFNEKDPGRPDKIAFSRAQLNPKFKYWKGRFREPGERRLIAEDNVESIKNILDTFGEEEIMVYAPNVMLCNEDTPTLPSFVCAD